MWCPKCKNEYVDGIKTCADCGCDLVASFHNTGNDVDTEDFPAADMFSGKEFAQADECIASMDSFEEATADLSTAPAPAHAFVSKEAKREDVKSTAYTFIIVGIGGIILLLLFYLGVIPIQVAFYMKLIIGLVMGAMFLIFLFIGIRSMGELKDLEKAAKEENELYNTITNWFQKTYSADDIDLAANGDTSVSLLYFSRYETMSKLITEKFAPLEDAFLDHVIEELYAELFPE